jgi:hypothetical protein
MYSLLNSMGAYGFQTADCASCTKLGRSNHETKPVPPF